MDKKIKSYEEIDLEGVLSKVEALALAASYCYEDDEKELLDVLVETIWRRSNEALKRINGGGEHE
ncbi:TPA: hypothetical protein ACTYR0_005845 [Klebsiella michiganensis]